MKNRHIFSQSRPAQGASAVVTNEGRVAVDAMRAKANARIAYGKDVWS